MAENPPIFSDLNCARSFRWINQSCSSRSGVQIIVVFHIILFLFIFGYGSLHCALCTVCRPSELAPVKVLEHENKSYGQESLCDSSPNIGKQLFKILLFLFFPLFTFLLQCFLSFSLFISISLFYRLTAYCSIFFSFSPRWQISLARACIHIWFGALKNTDS